MIYSINPSSLEGQHCHVMVAPRTEELVSGGRVDERGCCCELASVAIPRIESVDLKGFMDRVNRREERKKQLEMWLSPNQLKHMTHRSAEE